MVCFLLKNSYEKSNDGNVVGASSSNYFRYEVKYDPFLIHLFDNHCDGH